MDGIVGKTYQTYNSLPPCQEIDISYHKLSQNDNFVSRYPSSVATILKLLFLGTMWLRFSSRPWFRTRARNPVGPRPDDFWASPKFVRTWKKPINPRNLQACLCASEESRVTRLDVRPKFLIFFLNKKYWTCLRYQKLTNSPVCFPPGVHVQVVWQPSWKICSRIQHCLGFEAFMGELSSVSYKYFAENQVGLVVYYYQIFQYSSVVSSIIRMWSDKIKCLSFLFFSAGAMFRPSLTLVLSGLFLAYISHSIYTLYQLFHPQPCQPGGMCLKSYLARQPQLDVSTRWRDKISVAVNYRYSRYKIDMKISIHNRYGFSDIDISSF